MNQFAPAVLIPEPVKPIYDHGYTPEEVIKITKAKEAIDNRDINKEPVTLTEFKEIIVPWQRIQRTEIFILNPVKEKKERVPREKKEPKPKKLTKKAIKERLDNIVNMKVLGNEVSTEDEIFFKEHTQGQNLI